MTSPGIRERTARPALRRAGMVVGGGAAATALLGAGYVAATWLRYGHGAAKGARDPLLDRFLPSYDVAERHEIRVAAPATLTYQAARDVDLLRSRVIRAIFRGREIVLGSEPSSDTAFGPLLEQAVRIGWRILAEEPGREVVLGAVTRPWEPSPRFEGVEPERFAAFEEPGYVKIVWSLSAEVVDDTTSIARTETRVATTDAYARRRFRRYWAVFSAGIVLIRRQALRLVKASAERQYRTELVPVAR